MNIDVKILSSADHSDFSALLDVFEKTFEIENFKKPDATYLTALLEKKDFLIFVAKNNNEVIGGLTIHILDQYYVVGQSAYIYDLAVLPEYQRQGIGKKLISEAIGYCEEKGYNEIFVQAETSDQQAVNFYRSTEINDELEALHFSLRLN